MTPAQNSVLEPAGSQASQILSLFYGYLDVCALVFVLVLVALGFALGQKPEENSEKREPNPQSTRRKRRAVTWATVATVFTLVGLLIASVTTGHALSLMPAPDPVRVRVIGHKWWWEFRYATSGAATQFNTAYELHVPVGRAVELRLIAPDVIHSFWVPSLSGKRDAIPGKDAVLLLKADRPGVYEGQCAEFCGTEHASMRFVVVAESPERFLAWRDHQLQSAAPATDPLRLRGQELFMNSRCRNCHAISGTEAFGTVGPDLTHVASRRRLAMGTLPNDRSHLARWLADPQATKPGVQMPGTPLGKEDERALVAYLEGLK